MASEKKEVDVLDMKPNFCSECGGKLTGSAKFCPVCGAMQEFAAAQITEPAPVAEPVAVEEAVPVAVAEPTPAEAVAPAAAPETSLAAPKAKISILALILAIFALAVTFFTEVSHLYLSVFTRTYGSFDFAVLAQYLRIPAVYIGLLTAWVLPLTALLLVFWKKKPAALVCLIVTGVILLLQIVAAAYYPRYTQTFGGNFPRLWYWLYMLSNGENLFMRLRYVFSTDLNLRAWFTYLDLSVQFNYFAKNFWVLLACLFAAIKKK